MYIPIFAIVCTYKYFTYGLLENKCIPTYTGMQVDKNF